MNGRQIVFPPLTKRQVVRRYKDKRNPKSQQYAIFKAVDLKTRKQIETSCDPAKLSNYFEPDSNLPLEMSPVFFSADVLLKYKSDPTKYDLKDRSISCRGTWHLETFDVNEAGQVHTYLVYLSRLPYREQLYWQSFNILPKGFVSRRAFKTDFMGDWDTDYDSLNEVKRKIERLDEMAPDWWNYRGKKVLAAVHNPVTTSDSEWAESILALDQLVIEGFQEKALRSLAQSLKRAPHYEWRSLKLVEECLSGHGVSEVDAAATVTSLRRIRELRTTVKGHSAQQKKAAAVKAALTDHGTFRAHFENLTANCDESLRQIMATFGVAG